MNQQEVISLIKQKKFIQAKKIIRELRESKVNTIPLEKKFDKELQRSHKSIEEKILKSLNTYLKNKSFKEIFNYERKLKSINFNSKKIQKIFDLSHNKYKTLLEKEHKILLDKLFKEVDELILDSKYKEAILLHQKFTSNNPWCKNDHFDFKISLEIKRRIIDHKYKINKKQLKKHSILTQFEFIKKLYLIDPTYIKSQKLFYKYQIKLRKYDKIKKKILTKESILALKVLFYERKYESMILQAKKFLKVRHNYKPIINLIKKANNSMQIRNYKLAFDKIKSKK